MCDYKKQKGKSARTVKAGRDVLLNLCWRCKWNGGNVMENDRSRPPKRREFVQYAHMTRI